MCGMCARCARPRKQPTPRICRGCGRLAEHDGHGLCSACYQRDPSRIATWTAGAVQRLGASEPGWFTRLAEDLDARCAPAVAAKHLRRIERLLHDGVADPGGLVNGLRVTGRSAGETTRLVDEFFIRNGGVSHLDERSRRAQARRQRRLDAVPEGMRPAVEAFAAYLLTSRLRAALIGRDGLADGTIEARIGDLAVLAQQLTDREITDWSAVSVSDVEAFVTSNVSSRLATCRAFFAFTRRRKLILVDPTGGLVRKRPRGFAGTVLSREQQQRLLRRWIRTDLDPRERTVGLLCLIHGASGAELRHLLVSDLDMHALTVQLGRRPHPVPLDPLTTAALRDLLSKRPSLLTSNAHLLITKDSRSHATPCSPYFMTHVLDGAAVRPAVLRQTRLADFAHRVDPRLTAAAFGMTEGGALHYVTDVVDNEERTFGGTCER